MIPVIQIASLTGVWGVISLMTLRSCRNRGCVALSPQPSTSAVPALTVPIIVARHSLQPKGRMIIWQNNFLIILPNHYSAFRVDTDILNWFRDKVHKAGGGNYQTLINEALREYIQHWNGMLEVTLRKVLREELQTGSLQAPAKRKSVEKHIMPA